MKACPYACRRTGDWAGSAPAGKGLDLPPVRLFGQSIPLDATKPIGSVTLPGDPRVELYAVTPA